MLPKMRFSLAVMLGILLLAGTAPAADLTASLKPGSVTLQSAGPLAFGPDGVLFIGDGGAGTIYAIDTNDRTPGPSAGPVKVPAIDEKVAGLLGTTAKDILINDVAVNPVSKNIYLSVSRGKGPDAKAVLVRVTQQGKVEEVPTQSVKCSKAALPNPSSKQRQEAITDLAYVDGRVLVAGLSNEEWASTLRAIPFPFSDADKGAGIEIFHGAHGRFETNAPVRTFVTYQIKGEPHILAAYTCTPLVKIPVADLKPGARVKGTTVAELGNRNRPLDMITYQKDGKDYFLLANSARGVMKINTDNLDRSQGITEPVRGSPGTAGQKYDTISTLKGVEQLDKLNNEFALVLIRTDNGLNLESVPLP
jgi:hypothetical protein